MIKKNIMLTVILLLTLLFVSCGGGDVPQISSLSPDNRLINSTTFTLTVDGSKFTQDSVIIFNGTQLQTTYVSDTRLTAVVEPANTKVSASGIKSGLGASQDETVEVSVKNNQGESDSKDFTLYGNWSFSETKEFTNPNTSPYDQQQSMTDDLDGVLYAAWLHIDPTKLELAVNFSKSVDGGSTWSTPVDISKGAGFGIFGIFSSPSVCIDDKNVLTIAWTGDDKYHLLNYAYYVYSIDKGDSFIGPLRITSRSSSYQVAIETKTTLFVEPVTSTAHAAWYAFLGNYKYVACICYANSTSIGVKKSDLGAANFSSPKIVASGVLNFYFGTLRIMGDKAGRIHLIWFDSDSSMKNFKLYISSSVNNGASWSTPKVLTSSYLENSSIFSSATIAMDSNGYLYVVYVGSASLSDPWNAYFMKSTDNGATFSSPRNITNSSSRVHTPNIMSDSAGNISVTYQTMITMTGSLSCIRSYDGGNTFTDPVQIGQSNSQSISVPSPFTNPSYTRTGRLLPNWNSYILQSGAYIQYHMYCATSKWSK